MNIVLAEMQE